MNTGERIKGLRIEKGMTQEELGRVLGVGKAAIQKYEKGIVQNLKRSSIQKLADALECTPSYLMGWDDEADKNSQILSIFNSLNEKGKNKALSIISEFAKIDEYKKKAINLKIVARTGKNISKSLEVDEEQLNRILKDLE